MPDNNPADVSVMPAGSEPLSNEKFAGGVAALSVSCCEYTAPTEPDGSVEGETEQGATDVGVAVTDGDTTDDVGVTVGVAVGRTVVGVGVLVAVAVGNTIVGVAVGVAVEVGRIGVGVAVGVAVAAVVGVGVGVAVGVDVGVCADSTAEVMPTTNASSTTRRREATLNFPVISARMREILNTTDESGLECMAPAH